MSTQLLSFDTSLSFRRRRNSQLTRTQTTEINFEAQETNNLGSVGENACGQLQSKDNGYEKVQTTASPSNTHDSQGYLNPTGPGEVIPSVCHRVPALDQQAGSCDAQGYLILNGSEGPVATVSNPDLDSQPKTTRSDQGYLNPVFPGEAHVTSNNQSLGLDARQPSGVYEEIK